MKGIVFNLLEEAVVCDFGEDTWDVLLADAELDGTYTSLGNYADEEVAALVAAAAARLNLSPAEVLRWFGNRAMPLLKRRYGGLFDKHTTSRSFVLSVNSMIHPEVRKLYSGADCPFFHVTEGEDGSVSMGYGSSRRLCDLAHGFVEGAAAVYNEKVEVVHRSCMNHGAERCVMDMRWMN